MKSVLSWSSVVVICMLLLGCSDSDDVKEVKRNYFKIGETEYEIEAGILEKFVKEDYYDGYNIDLTFISNGLEIVTDEKKGSELIGRGKAIYFEMYSEQENMLTPGKYNKVKDVRFSEYTISTAISLVYDSAKDGIEQEDSIGTGVVSVSYDKGKYVIIIDCENVDGKKVTGYFEGELDLFDWSKVIDD
ncbi:hypothetical protein EMN47_04345 [Prolixibacteraceae bacterium JC049]|nr:hypothetical protein [Prolixibacteraceae bacterium JC049]